MAHKFEEKRKSILQQKDMDSEWMLNIFSWNRLVLNLKSGWVFQSSEYQEEQQAIASAQKNPTCESSTMPEWIKNSLR